MENIGIAIIGSGNIALANHLPGFALCPEARIVALCDANPDVLHKAGQLTGITNLFTDYHDAIAHPDVHAVVVATPNYLHAPISLAAISAKKHILCEKPIAMSLDEAVEMYRAAEAAGVRHMTAFTYRFVPAMHYISHLVRTGAVGRPYHFRAQRFQDWGDRPLGWRQVKKLCATGELGDMLSHRIDFAHLLLGPIARVAGRTRRFLDQRGGHPADVEDWVAVLADFHDGATGVLESTKLAAGHGEGARSRDYCEVNGADASLIYLLERPLEIQLGRPASGSFQTIPVPQEFLKWPGSTRDARAGDPLITFRYDQNVEFIRAIVENRPCNPSFLDGARTQAVMHAILQSERESRWTDVPQIS